MKITICIMLIVLTGCSCKPDNAGEQELSRKSYNVVRSENMRYFIDQNGICYATTSSALSYRIGITAVPCDKIEHLPRVPNVKGLNFNVKESKNEETNF